MGKMTETYEQVYRTDPPMIRMGKKSKSVSLPATTERKNARNHWKLPMNLGE